MTAIGKKVVNGVLTAAMATALLAVSVTANAQYVEHWRINNDQAFLTNGLTRGMAYNPATDNVLVATRAGAGPGVLVFNAEDGVAKAAMDGTGISGGFFPVNKIDAVDRGSGAYSVYVNAGTLHAKDTLFGTGPFILYRWAGAGGADEGTIGPPTRIYQNKTADAFEPEAAPIGPPLPAVPTKTQVRVGDSLTAIYDSVSNVTRIYLGVTSAQTADFIYILTVDEDTGAVTAADILTLTGHTGATSYGPTVDNLGNIYYFTNSADPNPAMARQYTSAGILIGAFDTAVVPRNSVQPRFMQYNGRSFVGYVAGGTSPLYSRLGVAEVTTGVLTATAFSISDQAPAPLANGNGAGDMALDTARNRFIGLATDNFIVSFSQDADPLLISLADLSAKVNEPSGTVTVSWETASEIDNVGFNVYRAEDNSQVNAIIIPSAGDGASYSLVDSLVLAPGETRGYILEDVDANNVKTTHGPVTVTRGGSASTVSEWPQF